MVAVLVVAPFAIGPVLGGMVSPAILLIGAAVVLAGIAGLALG